MRRQFALFIAALSVILSAAPVRAEIYTMYTKDTAVKPGTGTTKNSSLGLALSAFGGLINIPSFGQPPITGSLSGSVTIDMNLDASNTGTAYIVGSDLFVNPLSFNNGSGVSISSTPIGVTISSGPISVVNGVFQIGSSNEGSLTLSSGTLIYSLVIPPVFDKVGEYDFAVDPKVVEFADLKTAVLNGTADHGIGGYDSGTPDGTSHFLPGITQAGTSGLDPNDTDGAEFNLDLTGFQTTITAGGIPIVINLSGGIFVSVPEVGSFTMMGLAGAGLGLVGVARRRARNS